jgi:oligoribonuclease
MLGIFLDLETTGLDSKKHRIIEIAFKVVKLSTQTVLEEYDKVIKHPSQVWEQRDLESIKINGFSWERVEQGIEESTVKAEVISIFNKHKIGRGKAVFICQNPSFDRAFFSQLVPTYEQEGFLWPYHWLDLASMFWALEVQANGKKPSFHYSSIPLSKDGIARSMKLPPEAKPHRAMNGVDHLLLCYENILGS